jgi:hypothetical protein
VGTAACPAAPAVLTGIFSSAEVIGPNSQSLAPGELFSVIRAMRAGLAYANVHTDKFPGGEIRGQLRSVSP